MATTFWRKSASWWFLLVAMILTGTSSVMRVADGGSPVAPGFAIAALIGGVIAAGAIVRTWILHRRERAAR